ncbi:hypothetical protein D3C83_230610 [compost metagenome]
MIAVIVRLPSSNRSSGMMKRTESPSTVMRTRPKFAGVDTAAMGTPPVEKERNPSTP